MNLPIYSYLPLDIIIKILLRLPAKSIGRCRCVSKSWHALLSTPQFIKNHLDHVKQSREESIFLISYPSGFVSLSFDNAHHLFDEMSVRANKLNFIDHTHSWCEVIGSSNGLVLVGDVMYNKFLINPTLGEVWEVPISPFVLDVNTGYTIYGLGYDSVNDDYKIVALSYYFELVSVEQNTFVHVYSLRNDCWKKCECSMYDLGLGVEHITSGIFVGNCVHWLARRVSDYSIVIAAFNLEGERFYDVPLPTLSLIDPNKIWCHYLEVLGGFLCICSNHCDVWIMKEYGKQDSWTKSVIFDPERVGFERVGFRPMCMLGHEKLVLKKCEGLTMSGKLVTYDLGEKTFNDIVVRGKMDDDFSFWWTYMETLVSPHHIHKLGKGC